MISKKCKSVYLLNSPFQALSAFECLRFRSDREEHKIIHVHSGTQNSIAQTHATLDHLSLYRKNITPSGSSRLARFYSILKQTREMVASLGENDALVIGNISYDVFADAASRSHAGKKVALDDGLKTVLLWSAAGGGAENKTSTIQKLKKCILGLSQPDLSSLEYFSLFKGQEPEWAFTTRNEFQSLHDRVTPSGQEQIIILGQPIMEKVLSTNRKVALQFEKNIEGLVSQFPGAALKYYAHRNGDFNKIPDVIDRSGDVVYPDVPIELFLLAEKIRPVALTGFYSTALFSIAQIFRSLAPAVVFFLPSELGLGVERVEIYRKAASSFFRDHPSSVQLIQK